MNPPQFTPIRPEPRPEVEENHDLPSENSETLDLGGWQDAMETDAPANAGGRAVLGWSLALLAVGWTAYASWSAGRALSSAALTTPEIAQWVAIIAAPLGLLALGWLMFGRTRRREAEKFTLAVKAMQAETASLQDQLVALTSRIDESRTSLGAMAGELDGMADASVEKMQGARQSIEDGVGRMAAQGEAFDRSAANAKADMEKLLGDLPVAQQEAEALSSSLREAGDGASSQTEKLALLVDRLAEASELANSKVDDATAALTSRLGEIDALGQKSSETVGGAKESVDLLLSTSADALDEIRGGIDTQAAAVAALVAQAQAGIAQSGHEAAGLLGTQIADADMRLAGLSERMEAQDQATQAMLVRVEEGIARLDEQFATLAAAGDQRAASMQGALASVREQLTDIDAEAAGQDDKLAAMGDRTAGLRDQLTTLAHELSDHLGLSLGEANEKAEKLAAATASLSPTVASMREEAEQAEMRLATAADAIEASHQRLGELMEGIDGGVGLAEQRMGELRAALADMTGEAEALTAKTAPALVDALVQVRDAASRAGERAREAISEAIPKSAGELGDATREALEAAVQSSVAEQLSQLDSLATRAIEAARGATDKLSAQMLSIGQTAGALEAYMNEIAEDERAQQSEDFARRTTYLMESMHSAAIDVEKIISREVDDKSWAAYLKGERGVFTRKAVKLLSSSEMRDLSQHYDDDPEFANAVTRYLQDFEAMLRRVLAEREGEVMAVTLMSSDMGKLYAALGQLVAKRG